MKKKILVRGPALSQTGYGEQCRFALRALRSREDLFDIYLLNIPWGGTNWIFEDSEERRWLDELIIKAKPLLEQQKQNPQRPLFDISLQVTIPNELHRLAPHNILYTAGIETDRAAPEWIAKCHEFADKILVISNHAKEGLEIPIPAKNEKGEDIFFTLEKPIDVVHYPVKNIETKELDLNIETDFNFLVMAQWGPRKNLPNTIAWFCEEFHDDENVGLVVKTFAKGNSRIDKSFMIKALKEVLDNFPKKKCKVYFLHGYMNETEIHSLYVHPKIKAILNFGHGEGYGLPLFEAAYSGLPVITHNFGGQKDFLYAPKKNRKGDEKLRPHFSKINHTLKPVQEEVLWRSVIEPNMHWAYPSKASCKIAMREATKNYGLLQSQSNRLKSWLEEQFSQSKKYNKFVEAVWGEKVFDYDSISIEELPKISIITSVYNGDEFIESFLKDITRQTIFEEKCELILINAASHGNEEPIIKKYLEKYPNNIVYKKLEQDPGIYGVWNIGVEMASGEFLTNANLDDRKAPNALEIYAKDLYYNKHVDLVYADFFVTHEPNETFEKNSSDNQRYNFPPFSFSNLKAMNMPHAAPMWRKSIHDKNGLFDTSFNSAGDWEMWLRAASNGCRMKKINQTLGLYYFNPVGISTNPENFSWKNEEESRVFKKYENVFLK